MRKFVKNSKVFTAESLPRPRLKPGKVYRYEMRFNWLKWRREFRLVDPETDVVVDDWAVL